MYSLEKEKVELVSLNDTVVIQEQFIVDCEVSLEQLRLEQYIDDTSAASIKVFKANMEKSRDVMLEGQFLVAFGAGAGIHCIELLLVTKHFIELTKQMIHVCALGYSMSREQVSKLYTSLHSGLPVDFSKNDLYNHLFPGESDYERFGLHFLSSALVERKGDNYRTVVSNHVLTLLKYGIEKVPSPAKVTSILDQYERNPIG